MYKIKHYDGVYCYADKPLRYKLRPMFKVTKERWKQGQYCMEKSYAHKYLVDLRNGKFLHGLKWRVIEFCKKNKLKVEFENEVEYFPYNRSPSVPNITFRPEQLRAINRACKQQRGIIKFATGIGKTIIAGGLISCFPDGKILFFTHTKDLLRQTAKRFEEYGFDVGICGDGTKDFSHAVTVATIQTFYRLDLMQLCDKFDVVIVDECHHINKVNTPYFNTLTSLIAPVKIGLSASLPRSDEGKLILEGVIGPILDRVSVKQGIEKGYLVMPKIKLLITKRERQIADLRKYKDIYREAIINGVSRNKKIIRAAKRRADKNKTVLIFVKEIEHGKNLYKIAAKTGLSCELLVGSHKSKVRVQVKQLFTEKRVKCVITTLWKEGVDIPTLDCCINACGTKSEILILQFLGRVLRTAHGKKRAEMIDFLDPYKFLAEHSVMRLQSYVKEGLL